MSEYCKNCKALTDERDELRAKLEAVRGELVKTDGGEDDNADAIERALYVILAATQGGGDEVTK